MILTFGILLQACNTSHHTIHQYNRGRQKSTALLLNKQGPGAHWANKRERYSPID
jgi:hypothetical protein